MQEGFSNEDQGGSMKVADFTGEQSTNISVKILEMVS